MTFCGAFFRLALNGVLELADTFLRVYVVAAD